MDTPKENVKIDQETKHNNLFLKDFKPVKSINLNELFQKEKRQLSLKKRKGVLYVYQADKLHM